MTSRPVLPYVWMLCGSVAFASMGTMARALGSQCDWQLIAIARSTLPLVCATGLALTTGTPLVFLRPRTLWVRSIAGSVSMLCTFYALSRLPLSDVFTLVNIFPIWVALLSWPLLNERPTAQVWLSVAVGVVGVALIEQPHVAEGNFAALLALGASLSTAVAMIGLHRLKGVGTWAIVAHFSGVALVLCVGSFFLFDRTTRSAGSVDGLTWLTLLGIGATATLGQLFLTKAFSAGPPAKVSVVGLTQVVFAMAFDIFLWQRSFNPATLLGMALVMAPTAWVMTHRAPPVVQHADE